ncbi:MAG: PD-(D/E)XK nuclease family protein [Thermodesulfovibrionales bacterium]|jgi:CRISPR/Cas system-associated exonuclease Cas4 (RecB family)
MNILILPPGRDLIEELLSHLKGGERDYSPSLVVFPGKRPGHFLRKALAAKTGAAFIPPTVLSMDEFIDLICEGAGQKKKLETIDAVALLYQIHRASPSPLGGKGFMTPDSFFPIGLKLYRDIEELAIEGVRPQTLKGTETFISEGLPEQSRERLQSISWFYEQFYKEIAERGFSTRSARYRTAAQATDNMALEGFESIVFAGFFALTKTEKRLFKKLQGFSNAVFIFQQGVGLEEKLRELGVAAEAPGEGSAAPEIHFYKSPDTHGQVLALGRILAEEIEAGRPLRENTVIVLPSSETLFPLLRQGLSALPEEAYNVSLGYPLQRTPVFGFFNNLMELINSMAGDRIYIPDYLKFALHPYTKNIYFKGSSEVTRILFHGIEEELLRQKAKTFTTLREIEENRTIFSDVLKKIPQDSNGVTGELLLKHLKNIHRSTIERFLSVKNIGDFAANCMEVLVFLFNNSTARLHPLFSPFAESFIGSLDLLAQSLMKEIAFQDRSSYFIFLRKYLATCHTPFTGTPVRGLQVIGSIETRNLKFDTVYVLDANEEVLPDTRKEDTLLPFRVRQILGLPTYMDRDRLTAYYFDLLLQGARDVHIFFIENDRAERSRFVEKLLWEKQKKDRSIETAPYIRSVQYRISLENRLPRPVPKTGEVAAFLRDYSYNATALNRYLRCPLQFYYASVLRLMRRQEITGEIERDDLGNLVHAVLKEFFSGKKGRPLTEKDLDSGEIEALVEKLFEKNYGSDPSGALYLLMRQVRRHLADLLSGYYIPLVKNGTVAVSGIEEKISLTLDSFRLTGRIDSIEQRDEKTVIVDFKTGANPSYLKIGFEKLDINKRESWGAAINSLQLPFYALLYSEKNRTPVENLEAVFLLLGRSKMDSAIELPLFGDSSPAAMFEPLKAVIFGLLREIADPAVPFGPPQDRKKACPACDYRNICGTQWV